uniref:Uncharacterized protein n=1 Tax=Gloeothece verrucosa (strain PCC 7822) TaxID=497965 RepID=E0UHQ8_GLOV7|nr:hypothetical protein Cyan7822_1314 [Gloeothece verrucosa PCC 7822]
MNADRLNDILYVCLYPAEYDNPEEFLADADDRIERQKLLEKALRGEASIEDLADCLNDQGFNPDDWLDNATRNLEVLCSNLSRYPLIQS